MFPLRDTRNRGPFPFWIIIIIILNVYVFYLEVAGYFDLLILQYALIPSLVDLANPSSLIRFITNQFLHGGFLHIISNMWFLWVFGDNVEGKMGYLFFPIFYLISGVVGNLLQYITAPVSPIPIIGASGAIAGVLGAYLAFFPYNRVKTLIFVLFFITIVDIPASILLFYWFVLQLLGGAQAINQGFGATGGVAYLAHVGGFVFGWITGKVLSMKI